MASGSRERAAPALRLPHPLALLTGCILLAAVLTWLVPAGEYDRQEDEATGRTVVVAGTYHAVERTPVGPLGMLLSVPRGLIDAGDVVFLVFLVGGAFAVVDRTGALRAALDGLVRWLGHREALAIPIVALVFAAGGALENMQEEIIALVPALVLLARRLGYDALTAVAMCLGAAMVGSAFSPVNPFQVGIAQRLADVPLFSAGLYRSAFLVLALGLWIWGTMRYAARVRGPAAPIEPPAITANDDTGEGRTAWIIGLVFATFALFIVGLVQWGWGFNELSAVFLGMGILAGLIGRLGVDGTAKAFVDGFRDMAFAGLLIGFARAIYVVLADGRIVDTLVHALFTPLESLPVGLAAVGMVPVQALIHVPVPSVSGQAVLTMPILVPLSDLLGLSRQVTILAYQYGAGLCELLTPTNGALMAVLATAGVPYDRWIRFVVPLWAALTVLGIGAILLAIAIGLG